MGLLSWSKEKELVVEPLLKGKIRTQVSEMIIWNMKKKNSSKTVRGNTETITRYSLIIIIIIFPGALLLRSSQGLPCIFSFVGYVEFLILFSEKTTVKWINGPFFES